MSDYLKPVAVKKYQDNNIMMVILILLFFCAVYNWECRGKKPVDHMLYLCGMRTISSITCRKTHHFFNRLPEGKMLSVHTACNHSAIMIKDGARNKQKL